MSEKVDQVAKALVAREYAYDAWNEINEAAREDYRQDARAAIAAMREPTDDMLTAGRCTRAAWQLMISEALND